METHGDSCKLSKRELRKNRKKQNRAKQTLFRHEGIVTSELPTKHLVVANGGLGNGVQQEELHGIFHAFGTITVIAMLPRKPYAFISFSSAESASAAFTQVHGKELQCPEELSLPGIKFYLAYVEHVPEGSVKRGVFPPGLIYLEDFISEELEEKLINSINWTTETSAKQESPEQALKNRKVKHFGFEFMYGINNVDISKPLQQGIPPDCDSLLRELRDAGHIAKWPDQLTVNQYSPGQGIPPHIDTHSAFEDGIVVLSLGCPVIMDFKHPDSRHLPVLLPRRSVVIMTQEARYVWTHGITPRKSDIIPSSQSEASVGGLTLSRRGTRTSFTFRVVRRDPCNCIYKELCDSQKTSSEQEPAGLPQSEQDAIRLEEEHVHQVYEDIARHFSDTRHTAWPRIVKFLQQQPEGALMADIGCGNGKYLGINKNMYNLGCDRSFGLTGVCQERKHEVFVSDALAVPLREESMDICISIAVIHHFSTQPRRMEAVKEILRVLRPGGQALISVWALEQELNKVKSNYLKEAKLEAPPGGDNEKCGDNASIVPGVNTGSRGSHQKEEEDVIGRDHSGQSSESGKENRTEAEMVSNNSAVSGKSGDLSDLMSECGIENRTEAEKSVANEKGSDGAVSERGENRPELKSECGIENRAEAEKSVMNETGSDGTVLEKGEDRPELMSGCEIDNRTDESSATQHLTVHVNRTQFKAQDLLVPWHLRNNNKVKGQGQGSEVKPEPVFHRYYHVFKRGELEILCRAAGNVDIIESYYDKGNWCVILQKQAS